MKLTPTEEQELERLSDLVRKGESIGFTEALMVIEYQASKPKPKSLWAKIKDYIRGL